MQYDGSIRINTEINSKNANAQLMSLQNRIVKTSDKIASLRSKMDSLKDVKIPTEEYKEISSQAEKVEKSLNKLIDKQEQMQSEGKDNGVAWERLNAKIEDSKKELSYIQGELQDLVDTGKAFALGKDTQEFANYRQQLKYLENDYRLLIQRKNEFEEKHNIQSDDGYARLKKSLEDLYSVVSKVASPFQTLKGAFSVNDADISGYDRLESSLEDLKNTANNVSESVKKSFSEFKADPTQSILNMGNKMNSAVVSVMGSVIDRLNAGIVRIAEQFGYMAGTISDSLDNALDVIKEKISGLAGSMINVMLHPIQTLKSVAKNSVNGVTSILKSGLTSAMDGLKEKSAGIAANVINGLLHPFQSLKTVASSAINWISNAFSNMKSSIKKVTELLSKMGAVIKKIGSSIVGVFKKGASLVGSFARKVRELAQKHMPQFRKETEKTSSSFRYFGRRIKELVASALIFNQISAAFRAMSNGMKEGFSNLFDQVDDFRLHVNTLRASVLTLKNALAGAFRPLVEAVIPYIQKAVEYITMLVENLGQLFAALTGQTTYTKAIKMTADYFEEEEKAAKKATKAAEGYLSPLDEINKFTKSQQNEEDEKNELKTPMFEEVPIEGKFFNIANKIKDILSKLFAPLKEAWNREGKFVMDSWKYALKEIGKLAKDIGRDFLKVWQQPATIDMLSDMLHILGDIGLIVGNIAGKFREAWNYNNTGLHILENIRDIFAAIIHNIREAADYTVEWTKTLDFRPLLTSIENVTRSLIRFADFMSGTLADFYTQFILPLVSWTLSEQGLPRLFNILAAFMNEINWEGLRSALKGLYQALEPYAEEIGTGLIDFIEKMKEEGVEFFNFLPGAIQRAADALRKGDLPAAFYEFGSISGEAVKHAFNVIKIAIESIPWGEIGTSIASFINGIPWGEVTAALFGALSASITGAIDFLYNLFTTIRWEDIGHAFGANLQRAWNAIDWQKAGETVGAGIKGILDFMLATVQELDWAQIGRDIGDFLAAIPWGEILGNVFEILGTVFGGLLDGLAQTLPGRILITIGEILAALKLTSLLSAAVTALFTAIFGVPTGIVLGLFFSAIAALASVLVPAFINFGGDIMNGLLDGIKKIASGIGTWIKEHIFNPFINWFKNLFGIHSPSTVMEEQGHFIMQGLFNGIKSLVDMVVGPFIDLKDKIINKCNELKDRASEKFDSLRANAKESMGNLHGHIVESWNGIQEKFQNFDNFLSNVFSRDWSQNFGFLGDVMNGFMQTASDIYGSVKRILGGLIDFLAGAFTGDWSRAWEGIKNIFGGIWDGFATIVKNPINAIIGFANRLIEAVASMVNDIAKMLNSLKIDVPDGVPFVGGMKLGFNLPTWTPGKIPYLATGTVVPPNREFMAVLGDNKKEPEVVSPLSTIKQANRESLLEVLSELGLTGGGASGGNTYNIKAMARSKVLFELMIEEGKIQQMSTGKNPFMLGTT